MFDLIASVLLLAMLLPIWLIICLAVKIDSPGPVLFKQKRVGVKKTYFMILKFRSMAANAPKDMPTHLLKDAGSQITKVGKWLRRTSLDEVPQLINILRGEMSFVGPRPALWNQYDLIAERDKYGANDVVPGLTGWAQINGRDELSIDIKAKYDGYYVAHSGLVMDVKCVFGTLLPLIRQNGIREGESTKENR